MSSDASETAAKAPERNRRKVEIGTVTSDRMNKTRRVELQRLVPHKKYGKYQRKRTVCYAHDEENFTLEGDVVEIMETRPLSKNKCWRFVRLVRKGPKRILAEEAARIEAARSGTGPEAEGQGSADAGAGAGA